MKVFWTKKSEKSFIDINNYLNNEFGNKASLKFRNKVFNFIALLELFPEIGTLEVPEKDIRGFQISKQTRIFYRINKDHISLLVFFDSRQDPQRKPR